MRVKTLETMIIDGKNITLAGEIVDLSEGIAAELIAMGTAEAVADVAPVAPVGTKNTKKAGG